MSGLIKNTKNVATAKKVDQITNFFFPDELAVDEG
jgi:hypothetical protein